MTLLRPLKCVVSSINSLRTVGFVIPSWDDLIRERPNHSSVEEEGPIPATLRTTAGCCCCSVHKVFLEKEVRPLLDEPEEALLRSQGGPLASVPFTSLPTLRETTFAPQPFRLLLLCRLRLAFPPLCTLVPVWPSTRLPWSPPVCGVRGRESWATAVTPMGSVMARICRRGWRPSPHQRHGARPRPWCV